MYRFNTGLAMQTSLDQETIKSIYKLTPFLKDRIHDDNFMEQYTLIITSKGTPQISPSKAAKSALKSGITSEKVAEANTIESIEQDFKKDDEKEKF